MATTSQVRQSRRAQLEAQRLAAAQKERRNRVLLVAAGVIVFALVAGLAIWGFTGLGQSDNSGTTMPANVNAAQNGILLAPASADAPVLDIFNDFNCTVCKAADLVLDSTIRQAATSGQVTVVIHTMAFEADTSRSAAIAAACADVQGVFPEFYHQMYLNQDAGFDSNALNTTIPNAAGLWTDKLAAYQGCLADQATGKFVNNAAAYAAKMKVTATPTFIFTPHGGKAENITNQIMNSKTQAWDPDLLRAALGLA